MIELSSQQDYWNSRAEKWSSYDAPLVPGQQDLDFMREYLKLDGDSLIIGATPELCSLALEVSNTVTAVDYAKNIIEALSIEGVSYECMDWNQFFEQDSRQFDNIMTDGGLVCLEFPQTWQQLADNISTHLRPGGVFAARVYLSTPEPPEDNYENPNLARFVTSIVEADNNWMVHPKHGDYERYDVRYAFPPEQEVRQTFEAAGQLALIGRLIPDYEEGKRFISYAWLHP